MDQSSKFARNFASLTGANFFVRMVAAVVTIVVTNYFTEQGYGPFAMATSFATVFLVFAETGVGARFLYDRSGDKSQLDEHFGAALTLIAAPYMLSLVVTVAAAYIFRESLHYSLLVIWLVAIVSASAILRELAETAEKVLNIHQRLHVTAALRSFRFLFIAMGGIVVVWMKLDLVAWAMVTFLANGISVPLTLWAASKHSRPKFVRAMLWPTLTASYIFGIGAILFAAYDKVDQVMLSGILPTEEIVKRTVAIYAAAYNFITFMHTIPAALVASMEPLAYAAKSDKARLAYLGNKSNRGVGIVAMPLCVGTIMLAYPLRALVLPGFSDNVAGALQVLAIFGMIRFFSFPGGTFMAAAGMQRRRVVFQGIAVALNVAMNAVLIYHYRANPYYALLSSAWATVATEMFIWLAYNISLARRLPGYVGALSLAKPAAATAVMGAFIFAARWGLGHILPQNRLAWLIIVPLATALYFAALVGMRFFTEEEKAFVVRLTYKITRIWRRA